MTVHTEEVIVQTEPMAQRKMYTVRLSDEEAERLRAIGKLLGLDMSNTIRTLAMEKARALGIEPKARKKR